MPNPTNKPAEQCFDYDVIIIGTGPGGEGAAMNLAKQQKNVAIIERYHQVGGGCTHWGTIPSKALRQSVSRLIDYNSNPLFNQQDQVKQLTFQDILSHASAVIRKQVNLRSGFYNRNRVKHILGEASFINANTLEVVHEDGSVDTITAKQIVIATGSRPYRPDNIDFNHSRVYDSDSILSLQHAPRHVIIYGAGVIGSEYASIFRGLGVKVDLINTRERLLSFLDAEMSDSLSYHLWNNGVVIRHGEEIERVEANKDAVIVHLQSGKKMRADVFIGVSGSNLLSQDQVKRMAVNPIIFACSNPDPEIKPALAMAAREDLIMATGRSDYPNQVNNVLCFPFIFRGALDVRARSINDEMKIAAVNAIRSLAKEPVPKDVLDASGAKTLSFGKDYIIPKPMDPRLCAAVAKAVAQAAVDSGSARLSLPENYMC